jgi:hypothetical protein
LSRVGTVLLAAVVIPLGGAVLNSGGGAAVAWAVGLSAVAAGVHALVGKHRRPRRPSGRRR